MNLSHQTVATAPTIFPIKFNVLEVGGKISSQNKHRSYQNKNPQVKCQNQTLFNNIHSTIIDIILVRRDTIHSTTQTIRTLHENTQKQYHNQHIPTQPHLKYTHTHTHQNTKHKRTENFTSNKTIGPRQQCQI